MIPLSEQEREILRVAEEFRALGSNPAWRALRKFMEQAVSDADERLNQYIGGDSVIAHKLLIRKQERMEFLRLIDEYITRIAQAREDTMRDVAVGMGYTEQQAVEAFSFTPE